MKLEARDRCLELALIGDHESAIKRELKKVLGLKKDGGRDVLIGESMEVLVWPAYVYSGKHRRPKVGTGVRVYAKEDRTTRPSTKEIYEAITTFCEEEYITYITTIDTGNISGLEEMGTAVLGSRWS